jgi:hypothetical protein
MNSLKNTLNKLYSTNFTYNTLVISSSINAVIEYVDYCVYRDIVLGLLTESITQRSNISVISVQELFMHLNKVLANNSQQPALNQRMLDKYLIPKLCNELNLKLIGVKIDNEPEFKILLVEN